jgi:hypothetical protein
MIRGIIERRRKTDMIPKDPVMLLSFVNTQLRDFYPDFEALCKDKELDSRKIEEKLRSIDYEYDSKSNQFI